jgi:ATP-dependent exoDNAse (exonuclease V) beta subunit
MTTKLHFISAGAGSGKTYRLTQILHAKLTADQIRPSGVIATTFTRKAATELRERVRSHLLQQGAYRTANAMGQSRINTVNAVCGDLLMRFAFEAGMPVEQQILEEAQETQLLNKAIDVVVEGDDLVKIQAIARRMGIEEWRAHLSDLIKQTRANDIDATSLAGFAVSNCADLLSYFPKVTKDDLSGKLIKAIDVALPGLEKAWNENGNKKNTASYINAIKEMRKVLRSGDATWSEWAKLSGLAPEKSLVPSTEEIGELANRYAEHPQLQGDIRDYLQLQFTLCGKALQAYSDKKRDMGVIDFTDQEHLLLKVLDHETVAATLSEEIDLLMVDEFQDTSPIQLALFLKLASFAKEVYWVGDIKQAIYGFRGSDTTLMKSILDALTSLGGDKEVLDKSWRSRAPLVSLVNQVFEPAFSGMLKPEEIRLVAERQEPLKGAAFANWHLSGSNVEQRIAALVVGVKGLVESGYKVFDKALKITRPICFRDISILSRSNSDVTAIAKALSSQGIPVAIAQAGLMNTPEAVLALACLRRLNDPSDTIASAEIVSIAGCEEPETWVADRLNLMASAPEDAPSGYGNDWLEVGDMAYPLLTALAALRSEMPILSPLEAMQTVVAHGHLSAIVLRWSRSEEEARTRLSNLEAMLSMAREYEESSRTANQHASVSGLILWLNEKSTNGEDILASPAIDAVQVMTHHRAKGLEWPVVILTGLEKAVRDRLWGIGAVSLSAVDVNSPLKNRFIRFWPWPFGLMKNVSISESIAQSALAKKYRDTAIEEEKRLLYVSMTRARDLLVFTGGARTSEDSWINTINADWLVGDCDKDTLALPNGEEIPYAHKALKAPEAVEEQSKEPVPLYWFKESAIAVSEKMGGGQRLPLKFSPSTAQSIAVTITESIEIGSRMNLKRGADMARLGMAIHACIGTAVTDPSAPITSEEVATMLRQMEEGDSVVADELYLQIMAFIRWYQQRWPDAVPYAEIPTEMRMQNGQFLQGRIDLLLKVNGGWILFDHKSNPQGTSAWESVAQNNSGQLLAYKNAVELASGEEVLETWLFLPMTGYTLRVSLV